MFVKVCLLIILLFYLLSLYFILTFNNFYSKLDSTFMLKNCFSEWYQSIKGLWSLFMDGVRLSQCHRATTRRQFTFTTRSPGVPGTHLIDIGRRKG